MYEVYEEAYRIAKECPEECNDFISTYAKWILTQNDDKNVATLEEAEKIAKRNLKDYSVHYANNDKVKLMEKSYIL